MRSILLALTLLTPACLAQTPQDAPIQTLNVSTRIVMLDVVVTDKSGAVVNGLSKDDFTIYEDKVPQTIRYFEAPEQHALPRDIEIHSTAELQQKAIDAPVTVIVLDEINSQFEDMAYARSRLEKYISSQPQPLPQPTEFIAVDRTHFTVLHDYTQSGPALLAALKSHVTTFPFMLKLDTTTVHAQMERLSLSLAALEQITQAMAGHTGRKNIVWVGRGYPGLNISDTTSDQDKAIRGVVQKAVNRMRDNRVTLYTIDPTGIPPEVKYNIGAGDLNSANNDETVASPVSAAVSATGQDPFADVASFVKLADETGGKALYARNDIDTQVGIAIRNGDNFYTLSYKPTTDSSTNADFRKITIRLRTPGLHATTRKGYYGDKIAIPVTAKNQLAFDLNTASSTTMPYIGLDVTVTKDPKTPNTYILHLANRGLGYTDTTPGTMKASIVIQTVSYGPKDKLVGRTVDGLSFNQPAANATNPLGHVNLPAKAPTGPGATRLRFVVRDAATGHIGTADYTLP